MCLHNGHISVCRKTSSTFPASSALSSSHSRADDRNKGVDLRPVIISRECWCKATNFWGSKPRRREGRKWGWGDHVCGAAEATGVVIGRELWLETNSQYLPVVTTAMKPRRVMRIALSTNTCTTKQVQKAYVLQVKHAGDNKVPFQFVFTQSNTKKWRYFRKKNMILLVDLYGCTAEAANIWKGCSLISLNPPFFLFSLLISFIARL